MDRFQWVNMLSLRALIIENFKPLLIIVLVLQTYWVWFFCSTALGMQAGFIKHLKKSVTG